MPFDENQQRALLTNLARDRAEHLRSEIERFVAKAKEQTRDRTDLTEEQRALGEEAMLGALESSRQMLDALEEALRIAEAAVADGQDQ